MCALGNYTNEGWDVDPNEAPFTEDELEKALNLRQRVHPDSRFTKRADRCPHPKPCESLDSCVERIAWYLRYQREIEGLS